MNIDELKQTIRLSGIVGAGGAGFPSYAKIDPHTRILILNCAECEPLICVHSNLLARYTFEILSALRPLAETIGAEDVIVAVKSSYTQTIAAVEKHISSFPGMRLKTLRSVYPAGDEVVLAYEAAGVVIPPGTLPVESGVTVFNTETVYNMYGALFEARPVTEKWLTIAGAVKKPVTVKAKLGTKISDLLPLAGGIICDDAAFIIGGPMMGSPAAESDAVTKTTNAVLALPKEHSLVRSGVKNPSIDLKRAASACCQCSACTERCPRYLLGYPIEPHRFMRAAYNRNFADTEALSNAVYCSSCGVCEMVCPQSLHPRSLIKEFKAGLAEAGFRTGARESSGISPAREYRLADSSRLLARLGLSPYDKEAPLSHETPAADEFKIQLAQAAAAVKIGEDVSVGQEIGLADEDKLGVPVHSPVDGIVTEVTTEYICIKAVKR